jgi:hypothetical protein
MLAVVHALRVWRCYLEGADFTVYTDHVSNTYFQTQPNLSRRQARWSEFLQRFGAFEWKSRKGAKNVADALSRRDVAGSVWRFCCAASDSFQLSVLQGLSLQNTERRFSALVFPARVSRDMASLSRNLGRSRMMVFANTGAHTCFMKKKIFIYYRHTSVHSHFMRHYINRCIIG